VDCELAGETEVLGENLFQFHVVHHKSHMSWPGLEPGNNNCLTQNNIPKGTYISHSHSTIAREK
jgi:hypothetical protein